MNNLVTRSISGVGFILLMLAGLLINQYFFAVLVVFVMVCCMYEFYRMSMGRRHPVARYTAIVTGVVLFLLLFAHYTLNLENKYIALSITPVAAIMISAVLSDDKVHVDDFAYIMTGLLYIAAPLTLSNFIAFKEGEFSGRWLLVFFILIWCSDVGAYCVGSFLSGKGEHKKLCPDISPKKTWAGFWGGMVACIIAAVVLNLTTLMNIPFVHCIVLAIIIHVGGVFGDLFESLWKRHFGIKDSGTIIPGHGGMLDRFDSTFLAMPLGAIYLSLVSQL